MSDNRLRVHVGGDLSGTVVVGANNTVTNAPVRLAACEADDLAARRSTTSKRRSPTANPTSPRWKASATGSAAGCPASRRPGRS
jgi:hypothetical protein